MHWLNMQNTKQFKLLNGLPFNIIYMNVHLNKITALKITSQRP